MCLRGRLLKSQLEKKDKREVISLESNRLVECYGVGKEGLFPFTCKMPLSASIIS
jgi:hypothetical protein